MTVAGVRTCSKISHRVRTFKRGLQEQGRAEKFRDQGVQRESAKAYLTSFKQMLMPDDNLRIALLLAPMQTTHLDACKHTNQDLDCRKQVQAPCKSHCS